MDISAIRRMVTARQAAEALGLNPDRNGRCRCVWHADRNPSLKLYDGDKGCYCFACHHGGDVLDLTMQATHMPLREAAAWLNDTFRLGLDDDSRSGRNAREAARRAAEQRREQRRIMEERQRAMFDLYMDATVGLDRIDDALEATRPRRYSDGFSDEFAAALLAREEMWETVEELAVRINQTGEHGEGI